MLGSERILFERRRFIRVDGSFIVSYTDIFAQQPKSDLSQTKNISLGGILFTADRNISVGSPLNVKLKLPTTPDYINVRVKVVDCKERVKGIMYDVRAKFINISEIDRDSIRKIVECYLKTMKGAKKGG